MPKHGDVRNKRVEKTEKTMEFRIASTGEKADLTYVASEEPVSERYCEDCKEWVECKGLIEQIICNNCGGEWSR